MDITLAGSDAKCKQWPTSVLILGCGYLGTALAQRLLSEGVSVGALTRNIQQGEYLKTLGLDEVIVGDIDSDEWHSRIKGNYKAVVNCVSSAGGGLAGYQKSYVAGQHSFLKWAQHQDLETVCYTSSTSVYPQDDGVWVDELALTEPASDTAAILLEAEHLLLEAETLKSNRYVLRLAGIYGPQRHYMIDQLRLGTPVLPGDGKPNLNSIHRDDAVDALIILLQQRVGSGVEIFNVCDGEPMPKHEFIQLLAVQMQCDCPIFDPTIKNIRLKRRGGHMPDRKISNLKLRSLTNWKPANGNILQGYLKLLARD
jgi:nucleoside-diphosphate-sugar epimerase